MAKNLKAILTNCLFLLIMAANAQTIKLDFEPSGQIIKLNWQGLTICTDSTSLFSMYREKGTTKDYDLRVINFVKKQFSVNKEDTVFFSGSFVPFNDGIASSTQKSWNVDWAVSQLVRVSKLKIFDKHGQPLESIKIKKIGSKKKGRVDRVFINQQTNEELFREIIFMRTVNPSF